MIYHDKFKKIATLLCHFVSHVEENKDEAFMQSFYFRSAKELLEETFPTPETNEAFLGAKNKLSKQILKKEEVEKVILSSLLVNPETPQKIFSMLTDSQFVLGNRTLFRCMQELYKLSIPINVHTICGLLKKEKVYEEIGGAAYLAEILENHLIPASLEEIEFYANLMELWVPLESIHNRTTG